MAIKILRRNPAISQDVPDTDDTLAKYSAAFLAEARKVAVLGNHIGIAQVFEVGRFSPDDPDSNNSSDLGHTFVVFEFVDGLILGSWAAEAKPDHIEIATIVLKIAESLAYVHKQGIFHRDVKPTNVIVNKASQPILIDFGLAFDWKEDFSRLNPLACTPAYASPEQFGNNLNSLDGRTDIYACGVILYELLSSYKITPQA